MYLTACFLVERVYNIVGNSINEYEITFRHKWSVNFFMAIKSTNTDQVRIVYHKSLEQDLRLSIIVHRNSIFCLFFKLFCRFFNIFKNVIISLHVSSNFYCLS